MFKFLSVALVVLTAANIMFSFVLSHARLLRRISGQENKIVACKKLFYINYIGHPVIIVFWALRFVLDVEQRINFELISLLFFRLILLIGFFGSMFLVVYLKKYLYYFDRTSPKFEHIKSFFFIYLRSMIRFFVMIAVPFVVVMFISKTSEPLMLFLSLEDGFLSSYYIFMVFLFATVSAGYVVPSADAPKKLQRATLNVLCSAIVALAALLYLAILMLIKMDVSILFDPDGVFNLTAVLIFVALAGVWLTIDYFGAMKDLKQYLESDTVIEDTPSSPSPVIEKGYLKRKPKIQADTQEGSQDFAPEQPPTPNEFAPVEDNPDEKIVEEKPVEDNTIEDKPDEEKPVEDNPDEEKPDEEKPVEDKPDEEKPDEEKPDEDKPVEDKPDEEKPVKSRSVRNKSVARKPVANKPVEDKTVADKPDADKPPVEGLDE